MANAGYVERILNMVKRKNPSETEFHVLVGAFKENLSSAPSADINIFGLADDLPFPFMREAPELTKSSCLFVKDSGHESALA